MKKKETAFQVFSRDFTKFDPFVYNHNTKTVRPSHINKLNQIFETKINKKHGQDRKSN